MIQFECQHCQTSFTVPDDFAGRKGKCKACDQMLAVPIPDQVVVPMPVDQTEDLLSMPMRTRRLIADQKSVERAFVNTPLVRVVNMDGDPAENYRIQYQVRSLRLNNKNETVSCALHEVQIKLGADYPRMAPQCRMLTPVFHPNIISESTICIGDHWVAGEDLSLLIVRIGEIIGYQAYNIKSPLNAEAAMWADLNLKKLPTDSRDVAGVGSLV